MSSGRKICPIMNSDAGHGDWIWCQEIDCRFWQQATERDGDGECVFVTVGTAAYGLLIRFSGEIAAQVAKERLNHEQT